MRVLLAALLVSCFSFILAPTASAQSICPPQNIGTGCSGAWTTSMTSINVANCGVQVYYCYRTNSCGEYEYYVYKIVKVSGTCANENIFDLYWRKIITDKIIQQNPWGYDVSEIPPCPNTVAFTVTAYYSECYTIDSPTNTAEACTHEVGCAQTFWVCFDANNGGARNQGVYPAREMESAPCPPGMIFDLNFTLTCEAPCGGVIVI